jgi:hypothetical protein
MKTIKKLKMDILARLIFEEVALGHRCRFQIAMTHAADSHNHHFRQPLAYHWLKEII